MIQTINFTKKFEAITAVNNLNFNIKNMCKYHIACNTPI